MLRLLSLVLVLGTLALTGCRRQDPAVEAARDSARAAVEMRTQSPEVQAVLNETAARNEAAGLEASPVQIEQGHLATIARGAVRNGADDTLGRGTVAFDILGADGQVVRRDSFSVYNVAPGASAQYTLKLNAGEDSAVVRSVRSGDQH